MIDIVTCLMDQLFKISLYHVSSVMETVIIKIYLAFFSVQFNSVVQLCSIFCNPMDCSKPGFPVHHQLPEFTQTHVHRCHSTVSSSVVPFSSCLQFFPASGSFPISRFFTSGGQSIGVSASALVLPMNIQD